MPSAFEYVPAHEPLPIRLPETTPVHDGKRYIVTGAAQGLGRAVAQTLIAQGAAVVLTDVNADVLEQTASELSAAGHLVADVGDPDSIDAMVHAAHGMLGGFDGVVNIAGIVLHRDPLDTSWDDWQRTFDVNLIGSYRVATQVAARMIADGTPGAIVNTASEAGKVGHVESLAYSASKAGVISMTRMLAESLAAHDINVNCVCPGGLPTAMLRQVAENYTRLLGGGNPDDVFDRMITKQLVRHTALEEVAQVYSFLLSDGARVIRGQAVNADAGGTPY